ncbi:hypothetical protein G6F24_016764 [Rhizopus arrhizus]|nr:hypothetical protein G6F24_016764 [Rhizopus arrhizus]
MGQCPLQRALPVHRPQRAAAADPGGIRPAAAGVCRRPPGPRQRRPAAADRQRHAGAQAHRPEAQGRQDLLGAGGGNAQRRAAAAAARRRAAQ